MDKDCLAQGYCKKCGCATTHLQMANKTCEGKCYPVMMDKKKWAFYKMFLRVNNVEK